MDIIEETEKALATLHPKEREERIRDLDWPFEEGQLFTAGGFKKEDIVMSNLDAWLEQQR